MAAAFGVRKLEWLPFIWYQNIGSKFSCFATKHACVGQIDSRTDGQNYDPQDRASIAASRGKNYMSRKQNKVQ